MCGLLVAIVYMGLCGPPVKTYLTNTPEGRAAVLESVNRRLATARQFDQEFRAILRRMARNSLEGDKLRERLLAIAQMPESEERRQKAQAIIPLIKANSAKGEEIDKALAEFRKRLAKQTKIEEHHNRASSCW